jgi:hypothetical protein
MPAAEPRAKVGATCLLFTWRGWRWSSDAVLSSLGAGRQRRTVDSSWEVPAPGLLCPSSSYTEAQRSRHHNHQQKVASILLLAVKEVLMGATLKRKPTPSDREGPKSLQDRRDTTRGRLDADVAKTWSPGGRVSGSRSGLSTLRLVATRRPTEVGDVLILHTSRSFTVYAVGPVTVSGQRDFSSSRTATHTPDHAGALRAAKSLVAPGRRIHLLNIDTNDWSEIAE